MGMEEEAPNISATRLRNALNVLKEPNDHTSSKHPTISTDLLAEAFLLESVSVLQIYQAAACLREGQIKELVQVLIFRGPKAARVIVRLLSIMRGLPGNWELTMEFLEQQRDDCLAHFDERVVTFIAFLGGRKASRLCDWSRIIERALGQDLAESKLALAMASEVDCDLTGERVLNVYGWETELRYEHTPSFWRELKWATYTRSLCINSNVEVDGSDEEMATEGHTSVDSSEVGIESHPRGMGSAKEHYVNAFGTIIRLRTVGRLRGSSAPTTDAEMHDRPAENRKHSIVLTTAIHETMREVSACIGYGIPFILEGPTGCGKTSLISMLARATANTNEHPIHETEVPGVTFIQMDSAMGLSVGESLASLVGEIVPLPSGGGFRWRAGPIGLAAERGDWIVFENIGKAGSRMTGAVPILLQLARAVPGDTLDAPGRGEPIRIGKGFRCIATRTASENEQDDAWEPPGGWGMWSRIPMTPLSAQEKIVILSERFKEITDCVPRIVKSVDKIAVYTTEHRGPLSRIPTLREAVRICHRLHVTRSGSGTLSTENAFLETIDVLAAWCSSDAHRANILEVLSECWSLPVSVGWDLFSKYRPCFKTDDSILEIGRAVIPKLRNKRARQRTRLSQTGHTLRHLERSLRCLVTGEHVLLTGETGSGKTAIIQELAALLGKKLTVVNLSRQSELSDLVGGFRPSESSTAISLLARKFERVFNETLSKQKNERFLDALQSATCSLDQHQRAVRLMKGAMGAIPRKSKEKSASIRQQWDMIAVELERLELSGAPGQKVDCANATEFESKRKKVGQEPPRKRQKSSPELEAPKDQDLTPPVDSNTRRANRKLSFVFSEGVLVRAMREGSWILLDEINLAPPELLERLVSVVDRGEITLSNESGETVSQAEGFTLFGAMNPPTDVGKRPLPTVLRSRFTEFFVGDMQCREDIACLTMSRFFEVAPMEKHSAGNNNREQAIAYDVAGFYLECCSLAKQGGLEDTTGKPVRFSLRTLTRMLDFARGVKKYMKRGFNGIRRALYEGAIVAFATPLPKTSRSEVVRLARTLLLAGEKTQRRKIRNVCELMSLPDDLKKTTRAVEGYVVEGNAGTSANGKGDTISFVITPTVKETMAEVCRAMLVGAPRLPVLLQGPTAAGKTSLVSYLADQTGHNLIRINNHEHTETSEYLGAYVATADGSLAFSEGPLVHAARNGDWVVLDELNLAPPDVLEALNRLLDDNREIFLPETGEVVKAHKGFRLFATQNPAGLYGGRKELSRAFRSRFIEVQVDELPDFDLLAVLEARSSIPSSFSRKMVAVMRELQMRRRTSGMFSGREGYVTARDLFRWASRQPRSKEELAIHGFLLLGERSRQVTERNVVRSVLISLVGVSAETLSDDHLYGIDFSSQMSNVSAECLEFSLSKLGLSAKDLKRALTESDIVATPSMVRMISIVSHCVANSEPVLLVGATGGGKTSVCAALCIAMRKRLLTINCHRHTEASDILGGYRPTRVRVKDGPLFEWANGPLVEAMNEGGALLVDEINMADDAVIERLNSVLELERSLFLSEKGTVCHAKEVVGTPEVIVAKHGFQVLATMNPGGDFGKKELSPALRNRFTEVWIPPPSCIEDYSPVVNQRLLRLSNDSSYVRAEEGMKILCRFLERSLSHSQGRGFEQQRKVENEFDSETSFQISVRDLAAWCDFVTETVRICDLDPIMAVVHGARLVFLDGMCVGSASGANLALEAKVWEDLISLLPSDVHDKVESSRFGAANKIEFAKGHPVTEEFCFRFDSFTILRRKETLSNGSGQNVSSFSFESPNTIRNTARLARGMCVGSRPILLEGPPGCGKSSLIEALSSSARYPFLRINLSESTEMSDLVGSDAPGQNQGIFEFREGPLLRALKDGAWVLLDELNLASQSVLEGLNSVLDHRQSLYVPDTNEEIKAHPSFRLFGAQNPAVEGGGRRSLPKSFLNRFTRVQIEAPSKDDILSILSSLHSRISQNLLNNVVLVLERLQESGSSDRKYGLRDALRWCDLLGGISFHNAQAPLQWSPELSSSQCFVGVTFDVAILQSLRKGKDRACAGKIFENAFGFSWNSVPALPSLRSSDGEHFRLGLSLFQRKKDCFRLGRLEPYSMVAAASRSRELQAISFAINAGWPVILSRDSGSTSGMECRRLVEVIAAVNGKSIRTFYGGSFVDGEDFVGGFCQKDLVQAMRKLAQSAEEVLHCVTHETVRQSLESSQEQYLPWLLDLQRDQSEMQQIASHDFMLDTFQNNVRIFVEHGTSFEETAKKLKHLSTSFQTKLRYCCDCHDDLAKLVSCLESNELAAFEWQKSELINAIEAGDWVFLEDADVCPPAVLDRLNPIFERAPVSVFDTAVPVNASTTDVILAEAPSREDGSPVVMRTHPEFRMFFGTAKSAVSGAGFGLSRALIDRSLCLSIDGESSDLLCLSPTHKHGAFAEEHTGEITEKPAIVATDSITKNDCEQDVISYTGKNRLRCARGQAWVYQTKEHENGDHALQRPSSYGELKLSFSPLLNSFDFVMDPEGIILERDLASLRALERISAQEIAEYYASIQNCIGKDDGVMELDENVNHIEMIREELMAAASEAFVMGSYSLTDLRNRAGVLRNRASSSPSSFVQEAYGTYASLADVCAGRLENIEGSSESENYARLLSLPLDPYFSMDRAVSNVLEAQGSPQNAIYRYRSMRFRMEMLALQRLREVWKFSSGTRNRESIWERARLSYELQAGESSSVISGSSLYESLSYEAIVSAVRAIDSFCDGLLSVDEEKEHDYSSFFLYVTRLCEAMMQKTSSVQLLCTLYSLLKAGQRLAGNGDDCALRFVKPLCQKIRGALGFMFSDSQEHYAVIMPRTKFGQETEEDLWSALSKRDRSGLHFREADAAVKALATLSVNAVRQDNSLLLTLRKVITTIAETSELRVSEDSKIDHWSQITHASAVRNLARSIDSLISLVLPVDRPVSPVPPIRSGRLSENILQTALQLMCVPTIPMGSAISVQRVQWILEDTLMNESMNFNSRVQNIQKELMLSFLSARTNRAAEKDSDEAIEREQRMGLFCSILKLAQDSQPAPFWSLSESHSNAAASIALLVRGQHLLRDSTDGIHMLKGSFLSAFTDAQILSEAALARLCEECGRSSGRYLDSILQVLKEDLTSECIESEEGKKLLKKVIALIEQTMRLQTTEDFQIGSHTSSLIQLGSAWVSAGLIRLHSYKAAIIKMNGIDPSHITRSLAEDAQGAILKSIVGTKVYETFGALRIGGDLSEQSVPVQRRGSDGEDASEILSWADSRYVFRSHERLPFNSYEALVHKVCSTVSSTIVNTGILSRLFVNANSASHLQARIEAAHLVDTCRTTSISLELGGSMSHFRDLSLNFNLGIREVERGLSLCLRASALRKIFSDEPLFKKWILFQDITRFPRALYNSRQTAVAVIRGLIALSSPKSVIMASAQYLLSSQSAHDTASAELLTESFSELVSFWKRGMLAKEESDRAKSSLHLIREAAKKGEIPGGHVLERLDIDEDEDFIELFNPMDEDIEEYLLALDSFGGAMEHQKKTGGAPDIEKTKATTCAIDADSFCNLYCKVYSPVAAATTLQRNETTSIARSCEIYSLTKELFSMTEDIHEVVDDMASIWDLFGSQLILQRFEGRNETVDRMGKEEQKLPYNFYKDPNIPQLLEASKALTSLNDAVDNVQNQEFKDTGDHPVLGEVTVAIERVAKVCKMTTPLSTVVVGIENILRKADEWHRLFARTGTRLDAEISSLSRLVVQWRKLEMDSWPMLLNGRMKTHESRANKWVFLLFDAIIHEGLQSIHLDPNSARAVVSSLHQFLRSSPLGEFERRLQIIGALASHTCSIDVRNSSSHDLGLLLKNLASFYSLFLPSVKKHVSDAIASVQKELGDFARLISWDPTKDLGSSREMSKSKEKHLEYYRLKAAAEKTRRKLHKFCLKVDAILKAPVYEIMVQHSSQMGFFRLFAEDSGKAVSPTTVPFSARISGAVRRLVEAFEWQSPALEITTNISEYQSFALLSNLDTFQRRMVSFAGQIANAEDQDCAAACSVLQDIRLVMRARIKQLRDSPDHGIQIKKRALVDLLRGLHRIGLSPFERKGSSEVDQCYAVPEASSVPEFNLVANELLFVGAQQLQQLNEVSDSRLRNPDISTDEASRCRAFCGHLLREACSQRVSICDLTSVTEHILATVTELRQTPDSGRVTNEIWSKEAVVQLADVYNRLLDASLDLEAGEAIAFKTAEPKEKATNRRLNDHLREFHISSSTKDIELLSSILSSCIESLKHFLTQSTISTLKDQRLLSYYLISGKGDVDCAHAKSEIQALILSLDAELQKAMAICNENVVVRLVSPLIDFLRESDRALQPIAAQDYKVGDGHFHKVWLAMVSNAESLVKNILLGSQNALRWHNSDKKQMQTKAERLSAMEVEEAEGTFRVAVMKNAHLRLVGVESVLKLGSIGELLEKNRIFVNNFVKIRSQLSLENRRQIRKLQKTLGEFTSSYMRSMVLPCIAKCVEFHCSSLSFLRSLSSAFIGICKEGYCRPPEHDEVEDGEETEVRNGTGFGEVGDGDISSAQNVSDQIEDEEQLIGLQGDSKEGDAEKNQDSGDNDGFEMTNDFEGDLEDANPPEDQEEDTNAPEKQMSSEGGLGDEKIDEKLWDGDEENTHSEEAEDQKNSNKDLKQPSASEIVAKDDNPEEGGKQDRKEDEANKFDNTPEETGSEVEGDVKDGEEEEIGQGAEPPNQRTKENAEKGTSSPTPSDEPHFDSVAEDGSMESDAEGEAENCTAEVESSGKDDVEMTDPRADENTEMKNATDADADADADTDEEKDEKGSGDVGEDDGNDAMTGTDIRGNSEEQPDGKVDDGLPDDIPEDLQLEDVEDVAAPENENECHIAEADPLNQPEQCMSEHQEEMRESIATEQNSEGLESVHPEQRDGPSTDPLAQTNINEDLPLPQDDTEQRESLREGGNNPRQNRGNTHASSKSEVEEQRSDMRSLPAGRELDVETQNVSKDDAKGNPQKDGSSNDIEKTRDRNSFTEPNPVRRPQTDELVKFWERYLDVIQREKENDGRDREEDKPDGSQWEFKDGSHEKSDNDMHALTNATEDQQRPLPGGEEDDETEKPSARQTSRAEEKDSGATPQMEPPAGQGPRKPETEDRGTIEPDEKNLSEAENELVKVHPARDAASSKLDRLAPQQEREDLNAEGRAEGFSLMDIDSEDGDLERINPIDDERLAWSVEELTEQEARNLWQRVDFKMASGASSLCEQLRLVLEPTVTSGMAGGYRTGKRLNMRKVIEYVASDFRKDRIWLRRVRPDKRSYDVLLAIDDSASMSESKAASMAIESLALVTSALSKLEVGRVAVAKFGAEVELVRHFDEPLPQSAERGGRLLQQFTFAQKDTDIVKLLQFIHAEMGGFSEGETEHLSLAFIISDGRLSNRDELKRQLRRLKDSNVLVAILIVDKVSMEQDSIYDVKRVEYDEKGNVSVTPYMKDFPLEFYSVVQDLRALPNVMADALRQWIEATTVS